MNRINGNRGRRQKKTIAKRRKIQTYEEDCLQFRDGIWHAVMPIPRDVQQASKARSKTRFIASLETSDADEALLRLPAIVDRWRLEIARSRRARSRQSPAQGWPASVGAGNYAQQDATT